MFSRVINTEFSTYAYLGDTRHVTKDVIDQAQRLFLGIRPMFLVYIIQVCFEEGASHTQSNTAHIVL